MNNIPRLLVKVIQPQFLSGNNDLTIIDTGVGIIRNHYLDINNNFDNNLWENINFVGNWKVIRFAEIKLNEIDENIYIEAVPNYNDNDSNLVFINIQDDIYTLFGLMDNIDILGLENTGKDIQRIFTYTEFDLLLDAICNIFTEIDNAINNWTPVKTTQSNTGDGGLVLKTTLAPLLNTLLSIYNNLLEEFDDKFGINGIENNVYQ